MVTYNRVKLINPHINYKKKKNGKSHSSKILGSILIFIKTIFVEFTIAKIQSLVTVETIGESYYDVNKINISVRPMNLRN